MEAKSEHVARTYSPLGLSLYVVLLASWQKKKKRRNTVYNEDYLFRFIIVVVFVYSKTGISGERKKKLKVSQARYAHVGTLRLVKKKPSTMEAKNNGRFFSPCT